jgi:hypothetical protein
VDEGAEEVAEERPEVEADVVEGDVTEREGIAARVGGELEAGVELEVSDDGGEG